MRKICIILGTRPEIIKMSPIILECQKRELDFFIIHTGQHYSFELDKIFFEDLSLPKPKYNLDIGSGNHGEMTGKMLIAIESVLTKENPDIVLVEGDTNSVLAGALAAVKLNIKVGHIEAGLRSYDRFMPEEINRVMVDHVADFLFVPTLSTKENLLKEGIDRNKIFIVGNTIVDAVLYNIKLAKSKSSILDKLEIKKDEYALLTLHRPSNVDNKESFSQILNSLAHLKNFAINNIIFPIHPRTEHNLKTFDLLLPECVKKIESVGYLDMLQLIDSAKIILTDSGGIQEEACILNTLCVTLRDNTERPETLKVKSNILAGNNRKIIINSVEQMLNEGGNWENPFGDGKSAMYILDVIVKHGISH
jgi:UDP-N-acetylglucosamine 2-epimerase (non-hydrolysing)